MAPKFEEWLNAQQGRTDLIGALARVPSLQYNPQGVTRQKTDEHKTWALATAANLA